MVRKPSPSAGASRHTGTDSVNLQALDAPSLGSREGWAPALRAAIDMMHAAAHPMGVIWGADCRVFSNDPFAALMEMQGNQGVPLKDLRPDLQTWLDSALQQTRLGQSTVLRLPSADAPDTRAAIRGQTMILSPLCDETGIVAGALATCLSESTPAESIPALRDMAAYRTLFEAIDQGFCLVEIMLGPDEQPCDYRFLEVNTAFAHHTGLTDAVGRTALDLVPGLEQEWIAMYGAVARTGESVRREYQAEGLGRYYDLFATRVGGDGSRTVAIIFRDITERRAHEANLRKSGQRQAFLLSLADALRQAAPLPAQKEACRLLAHHLQVDRAFFAELDEPKGELLVAQDHYHDTLTSVAGRYRADSFGLAMVLLRRGDRFEVCDMRTHSAIPSFVQSRFLAGQIAACLAVPVILGGRLAGAVCVTTNAPRRWTEADTEILTEAGQRIWAAVAQTRAETVQLAINTRFRTLVEGMPQLVWRAAPNGRWTWASPQWSGFTGLSDIQSQGTGWLEAVHPEDRSVAEAAWARTRDMGRFEADYRLRDQTTNTYRWFQTRALRVRDQTGHTVEWLGTSTDVQDLHDMQAHLRTLVAELQHRTRNLMAVVMAVTDRTLGSSDSLDAFRPVIQARLGSIARTNGLLSKLSDDGQITFDELLDSVFEGHGIGTKSTLGLSVSGPTGIRLRSSSVQTLALALHELAAEALAQGGLSGAGGRLTIAWELAIGADEGRRLLLSWDERFQAGGTVADLQGADDRMTFSRELIELGLPYQLNAKTTYHLSRDRLACQVDLPLGPART